MRIEEIAKRLKGKDVSFFLAAVIGILVTKEICTFDEIESLVESFEQEFRL